MEQQKRYYHSLAIRYLILVWLLLSATVASAQYRSSLLEKAASALGIQTEIDEMTAGDISELSCDQGIRVIVRKDETGQVVHIGLPLFSQEIRQQLPSPVYDCLEYAALDRRLQLSENDLLIQKIRFFKGSWQTVYNMEGTDGCSISIVNDKHYVVTWKRDGKEVAQVVVPMDYELLNHCNRRELELSFARNLKIDRSLARPDFHINEELLHKYGDTDFYVLPGDTFLLASLNRNTYYQIKTVSQTVDNITYEEERLSILIDRNHPGETLANLLISTDPQVPDALIELEIQLSNYNKQTLTVSLRQLMYYCQSQGCTPYFTYDNNDGNTVSGSLLMRNSGERYNHLINLTCSTDDLVSDVPSFKGKAYLFIPTVDATKLFGKGALTKSGMKIEK